MRISSISAALLLALAGCHRADTPGNAEAPAVADVKVPCALDGSGTFAADCTVERETREGAAILTLHHPDGGFRRLTVTSDGRGVAATDGAERARVAVLGNAQIEIAIGRDRYRLPATIKATRPA